MHFCGGATRHPTPQAPSLETGSGAQVTLSHSSALRSGLTWGRSGAAELLPAPLCPASSLNQELSAGEVAAAALLYLQRLKQPLSQFPATPTFHGEHSSQPLKAVGREGKRHHRSQTSLRSIGETKAPANAI